MVQTNNTLHIGDSLLYELAMSIGGSLDLEENCSSYLQKLYTKLALTYAGLWVKKETASSYFEYCHFSDEPERSLKKLFEENFLPQLKHQSSLLIQQGNRSFLIFQVNNTGVVLLQRTNYVFDPADKRVLLDLMNKFGIFLQSLSQYRNIQINDELHKELRFTQSDYAVLFRHMVDGIFIYNYSTEEILDCNEAAVKLFGCDRKEDLIGLSRFDIIPDSSPHFPGVDFREYVRNHGVQVRKKEIVRSPGIFIRKDGSELLTDVNIIPTFKNESEAFVIFHDMTNRVLDRKALKKTQKLLEERNAELKKYIDSNLQLENFAYMASHDLKTPIRSIVSFTQLLERSLKDKLNEEEKDFIQFIINASRNMQDLIQALLNYSRANTTEREIEAIDLLDLLKQINMQLHPNIEEKKAHIELKNLPTRILADRIKLGQLFQNLLTNALKFTSPERNPIIEIACVEKTDYWEFSIEDNGIGIERTYQDKIFLLFRRLHSPREYDGAGIGLATCKKIVQQHDGKIWVESEFGIGTKFYFTISKDLQ